MTESTAAENLLYWCSKRGFWIDPRIQVNAGPCGVAVISRDISIPADSTREWTSLSGTYNSKRMYEVVRIPRESVLSVKSSSITDLIPPHPHGRGAQLSLALALSVELSVEYSSLQMDSFSTLQCNWCDIPVFPVSAISSTGRSEHPSVLGLWRKSTESFRIWSSYGVAEWNRGLEDAFRLGRQRH
jgi:hypothetical protein